MVQRDSPRSWQNSHDGEATDELRECLVALQEIFERDSRHDSASGTKDSTPTEVNDEIVQIHVGHSAKMLQKGSSHVVFDVEMLPRPSESTQTTNGELAIILDVSGSMAGNALEYSKKAVLNVIDSLREDDILHIVTYATESSVIFNGQLTPENKIEAKLRVTQTESSGCTNMSAGFLSAVTSIADYASGMRNRRMFIFTDGFANVGVQQDAEVVSLVQHIQRNFAINCTAFGMGADFNDELMMKIASSGHGDYFYIDGPEDITSKVSKGLGVVQSLYAIDAQLTLLPISKNGYRVSIGDVYSYQNLDGSAGLASLGDLCFDDLRQVLCRLELDGSVGDSGEILQYVLRYGILQEDSSCLMHEKRGTIQCTLTDCESDLDEPNNLLVAMAIREFNGQETQVMRLIRGGDYEEALQMKKEAIRKLEEVSTVDSTGVVDHLIVRARATLLKLEQEEVESLEKDSGYLGYECGIVHRKCF